MAPPMDSLVPDLSLVVPVWKGEGFVAERLTLLSAFLEQSGISYEIIPVDDGSPDRTKDILDSLRLPHLRPVTDVPHRGKFGALREGMKRSRGRVCLFTDADIPYDLAAIPYLVQLIRDRGFHLAIGDRTLRGSVYAETLGPLRRLATAAFTMCIRLLVTGGLFDTQCGIKAFRGDVARSLFPLLKEEGFAGDVEVLYIALKYNLEIKRVPVKLRHHGPTSVEPIKHGLRMLRSVIALRGRWADGAYRSADLDAISAQDYGSYNRQ